MLCRWSQRRCGISSTAGGPGSCLGLGDPQVTATPGMGSGLPPAPGVPLCPGMGVQGLGSTPGAAAPAPQETGDPNIPLGCDGQERSSPPPGLSRARGRSSPRISPGTQDPLPEPGAQDPPLQCRIPPGTQDPHRQPGIWDDPGTGVSRDPTDLQEGNPCLQGPLWGGRSPKGTEQGSTGRSRPREPTRSPGGVNGIAGPALHRFLAGERLQTAIKRSSLSTRRLTPSSTCPQELCFPLGLNQLPGSSPRTSPPRRLLRQLVPPAPGGTFFWFTPLKTPPLLLTRRWNASGRTRCHHTPRSCKHELLQPRNANIPSPKKQPGFSLLFLALTPHRLRAGGGRLLSPELCLWMFLAGRQTPEISSHPVTQGCGAL